jgi:predicted amidophosphoribosyltransferase
MPTFKHPCPYCGKFINRDVAACPFCATRDPFAPRRCPNCSKAIEDPGWIACPACGLDLRPSPVIGMPLAGAGQAAASSPPPAPTYPAASSPVAPPLPSSPMAGVQPPVPPAVSSTPVGSSPVTSGACTGCGAALAAGARFCTNCGTLAPV